METTGEPGFLQWPWQLVNFFTLARPRLNIKLIIVH